MSLGIRAQLGLTVTLVVATVFFGAVMAAVERDRRELDGETRERAGATLAGVAVPAAIALAQGDYATLDTLVAEVDREGRRTGLVDISVIGPDGRIMAHSKPERFGQKVDDPFSIRAVASNRGITQFDGTTLMASAPASSGLRWGTLVARFSLERQQRASAERRTVLLGAAGTATVALLVLLVFGLHILVVRPVRALQQMAEAVRAGDLERRATKAGPAELRALAGALNDMTSTLKARSDHLSALVSDRTRALSEANAKVERLATTDGLTGLFNHRYFHDTLVAETKRSSRTQRAVALLMIDVDHFKRFNDSNGHAAGDELLRDLARVLKEQMRSTDCLARYGGEEFAAILVDTPKGNAADAAEKVRAAVDRAFGTEPRRLTVSVGVAAYPDDGDGPQAVLRAADDAVCRAKEAGRNRVVVSAIAVDGGTQR